MSQQSKSTWLVEWQDPNHRAVQLPLYLGRLIPGKTQRAYLYFKNMDHNVEDIKFILRIQNKDAQGNWIEDDRGWAKILRATENLRRAETGQIVIEFTPPLDLSKPPRMNLEAKVATVQVG